jgi:hypothetical protein
MSSFDLIMFFIEGSLSHAIYYISFTAGPIDISKVYMLKENKRIYGMLVCFLGGIKLGFQGLAFDDFSHYIVKELPFFVHRLVIILALSVAIFSLL